MQEQTFAQPEPVHSGVERIQGEQSNLQVLPPVDSNNAFSNVARDRRSVGIQPSGMDMLHAVIRTLEDGRDDAKSGLRLAQTEISKLREQLEEERRGHAVCEKELAMLRAAHRVNTINVALGSAVLGACVSVLIVTPTLGWPWFGAVVGAVFILTPLFRPSASK